MPRIAGVDIPSNKRIEFALRYIYGIGPKIALDVLKESEVEVGAKASDLTEEQVAHIGSVIDRNYQVEGQLRRTVQSNIARLKDIRHLFCRIRDPLELMPDLDARIQRPVPEVQRLPSLLILGGGRRLNKRILVVKLVRSGNKEGFQQPAHHHDGGQMRLRVDAFAALVPTAS
ncbi:MAG: 30S ribosomal protein S13 [Planctomycetes bacterium]|nr:30S ribosomal protein S13 [Planctomycetota bacterium]